MYKWYVIKHGWLKRPYYVRTTIYIKGGKGKSELKLLHHIILGVEKNTFVDHINNDPLDNRKCNLRVVTNQNNLQNRSSKNSNNKSGYRNVCYNKAFKKKPWQVQLQINGKNTVLCRFDDVHEAGKFAEEMRQKYYRKFAGKS